MADIKLIVADGQDVFDIAIERYGTISAVPLVLEENAELVGYNTAPVAGSELVAAYSPLNAVVVQFFKDKRLKPANAVAASNPRVVGGAFSGAFNISFR
jgi:hypothetical protein